MLRGDIQMNNDDKKLGKAEYFELREKRLKLVYKILYVFVAIWIAGIFNISSAVLVEELVPEYAFLLAVTSLMIIKIVKYALMEFRCMKVVGNIDETILKQTEDRYDNILKSFGIEVALSAELMIFNVMYPSAFSKTVLPWVIAVCSSYFLVISLVGFFKKIQPRKVVNILDTVAIFVGAITAYTACNLICLVAI